MNNKLNYNEYNLSIANYIDQAQDIVIKDWVDH
jgi:hypothetical protein